MEKAHVRCRSSSQCLMSSSCVFSDTSSLVSCRTIDGGSQDVPHRTSVVTHKQCDIEAKMEERMKLLDSPSVAFDSRYVLFQCLQHFPHLAVDLLFCSSILTTFSHPYRFVGDRPLAEAQEHLKHIDKTFDSIFPVSYTHLTLPTILLV